MALGLRCPSRATTTTLKISGTSRDNTISDCHVNVIVNDVKPCKNASATGTGGPNDYSKLEN
jgi:hypothetical protein